MNFQKKFKETMLIPNNMYESGVECFTIKFTADMINGYLDNLTVEEVLGSESPKGRKFAFATDRYRLDNKVNYSPLDLAVYPAEMLIDQTRIMTPSGKDIPNEEAASYMIVVSGMDAFNCITYDKFIASIFHNAHSLGGVISDKGGYILTTKGYRIKQTANRMAGSI